MLTQNPDVRKEITHLADSADSTIRRIRHAARDTRDAVGPVSDEVKALIAQLEQTIEVLAREGSEESLRAGRRLRERAGVMAGSLRAQATAGVMRARDRMDDAVGHAQQRVSESPLMAVGLAAAIGALIGLMLSARHRD